MKSENFIAKYNNTSLGAQSFLACHQDASRYSFGVSLNIDYEGGGTWYPRQNKLIKLPTGYAVLHPSPTHRHGARPVIEGTRYILISFCNQVDN